MSDPVFQAGYRLFLAGKFERAIEALIQVVQINPQNADAYNHLGLCYDALAQYDKAITNYRKATEICERYEDENNVAAMKVHLADSLIAAGRYEEGEDALQEVVTANVEDDVKAQAFSILATSLILRGRLDEALEKLKEGQMYLVVESAIREHNFGSGIFAMIRARIYTGKHDFPKALINFDTASGMLRDNPSAMAELDNYFGEFLAANKEPKKALKLLERSWKYFSKHKPSYAHYVASNIADAYNQMGKAGKADFWRKKVEGP